MSLPSDEGWLLNLEHFFNQGLHLGHFDDSLVLAMMAARDPSNVLSLAATARLAPRAPQRDVVSEILSSVGCQTKHQQVREAIEMASSYSFNESSVDEARRVIRNQIADLRKNYFDDLKRYLSSVMTCSIDSNDFVQRFFELSEKSLIRADIFSQMVHSLIRSEKVRPSVKILLINNLHRMPKKVKFEVAATIQKMSADRSNSYLRNELMFYIESGAEEAGNENRDRDRGKHLSHIFL
ncbi:putative Vitellogenin domain-containing protein [Azospirillaceae bacterium]